MRGVGDPSVARMPEARTGRCRATSAHVERHTLSIIESRERELDRVGLGGVVEHKLFASPSLHDDEWLNSGTCTY